MTDRASVLDRIARALARPVDGASLAAFRLLFGLMMCAGVVRFMANGWIERFYGQPSFWFRYWGFEWLPVPSVEALYWLFTVLAIAALGIAFGALYRLSAAVFFLGFSYAQLLDVTNYLNHYYLVCLLALILCFAPLHRTASVDNWLGNWLRARLAARRAGSASEPIAQHRSAQVGTVPAWALWLLRFQVGTVYIYAGLAKAEADWLLHAQPLNIWFTARTEMPIIGPLLAEPALAYIASWGVFGFELAIVPLLLWPRSRGYIYAVIVGFHAMTHAFFDIGMFPFIMVVAATVFFAPAWPRRFARRWLQFGIVGPAGASQPHSPDALSEHKSPTPAAGPPPRRWRRWHGLGLAALGVYCAIQVLVPLRHWLYPGTVSWNEEGMRWSWKVMLREKHGSVTFFVQPAGSPAGSIDGSPAGSIDGSPAGSIDGSPAGSIDGSPAGSIDGSPAGSIDGSPAGSIGKLQVSPRKYLDSRQSREMAGQPDLILQLAHHIADDFEARGYGRVAVYAEALVSLNGRPAAPMIDPTVDLTQVEDGLARKTWILPEPQGPPIHLYTARLR